MHTLGFTGTQRGMTVPQLKTVYKYLLEWRPARLHHGCCIGADSEVNALATVLGIGTIGHPPTDQKKIGVWHGCNEQRKPKPYLDRDLDIVTETESLLAVPYRANEELRSGTWATVRRARILERPVTFVYPNGVLKEDDYYA